jgi:uncharacterized damage-inducible protein DinB
MWMDVKKCLAVAGVAACLCAGAQAQMKCDMDHGSKGMDMKSDMAGKSFDGLLSMAEKEIVDDAEAMPADKYDFAPSKAIFKESQKVDFDSPKPVASFAQQLRHISQANYYFFATKEMKPTTDVKAIGSLKSKDQIIAALKESFAFAHKSVSAMTAANAFDQVDAEGQKSTRAAAFAFGLMHMNDHYGQLNEYLRMNGIVPPASRK